MSSIVHENLADNKWIWKLLLWIKIVWAKQFGTINMILRSWIRANIYQPASLNNLLPQVWITFSISISTFGWLQTCIVQQLYIFSSHGYIFQTKVLGTSLCLEFLKNGSPHITWWMCPSVGNHYFLFFSSRNECVHKPYYLN